MKSNAQKLAVQAGTLITPVQGFRLDIKCAATFDTEGSHRPLIEEMLGDVKLCRASRRLVTNLDRSVEKATHSIVIIPSTILHVRRSANAAYSDPFHVHFPNGWSMNWLPPQFRIQHLSLNAWAAIAPQLTDHERAELFVDVWCGALHVDHRDGKHTTLFKFVEDESCGGLMLKAERRCEKPLHIPNGFVAFGIYELA